MRINRSWTRAKRGSQGWLREGLRMFLEGGMSLPSRIICQYCSVWRQKINIQGLCAIVISNVAPYRSNDRALTLRMGRVTWAKGSNCTGTDRNKLWWWAHHSVYSSRHTVVSTWKEDLTNQCGGGGQSLSHVRLSVAPRTAASRLPCPSLSPRVCSRSCPLSRWCHQTISSTVVPLSFCPQSFPASGSFPMSWLLLSGGQTSEASASVLTMNMDSTKLCPTLAIPWTVARQAPLSVRFSRQEYWSALPFPSPGELPDPEIEPRSPVLQADALLTEIHWKPLQWIVRVDFL